MKIRCLIVDDEPLARSIIAQYASKLPYLAIVGNCEDAVEASEFLRHTDIDLVFLDINMPGIDGMTFAKTLDNSTLNSRNLNLLTFGKNPKQESFNIYHGLPGICRRGIQH